VADAGVLDEEMPRDGMLPGHALRGLAEAPLSFYVHVPFCATRCGYCDFNTYTAAELGGRSSPAAYVDAVLAEIQLARRVLGESSQPVATVFFGGGTPTLLSPEQQLRILRAITQEFGLVDGAEVTTEANPDSVDAGSLAELRAGGINRISFGVQSFAPHVLAALDRRHDPERVPEVVAAARRAGFEQVSLDLIYGSPGESVDDWSTSVRRALELQPDHVSAYALTVEPGTALARRVRRGEVAAPDDDDLADKYVIADDVLTAAGLRWYEISNWSTSQGTRCRHNLGYWTGANWWGAGPGAHSHVGGVRWWNVKHPAAYADRLASRRSPAQAREVLDPAARRAERVMLELRLASGLPSGLVARADHGQLARIIGDGLVEPPVSPAEGMVLTRRGRLLADTVVHALVQ
jgi:oxygen-independent coproporphyrinogen-3 oxidase